MSETADDRHWWSTPKAFALYAVGGIALVAALITNSETIYHAADPISLRIQPGDATPLKELDSKMDDNLYYIDVKINKAGAGILHNCNFSVRADGDQARLRGAHDPFDISDGDFDTTISVGFETYSGSTSEGRVSLICDVAGSRSVSFKVVRAK